MSVQNDPTRYTSVRLIIAPFHAGIFNHRVGAGPTHLLSCGLIERLRFLNIKIDTEEVALVYDFEGDIGRSFEVIRRIARAVRRAVEENAFPVILAGNCNASVGVAGGLQNADLGFVWFDAHSDLDTPDETVSGYLDGMGVSMLAGKSWKAFLETIPGFQPINLERVVYCGVRDLSDAQHSRLQESPARAVYGKEDAEIDFTKELDKELKEANLQSTVIHLDVDCLDTALGKANEYAAPGGLSAGDLSGCMELLLDKVTPVAMTVASYNPKLGDGVTIAEAAIDAICKVVASIRQT
ncbi:arginase, putative [Paecilomyces variotii No. 5]|uniref:Arginase, putative n=1 Tax=Byssochlamys spectabilis (strain No. 5 / NBRC 109023) TaxID=1356009 RepID=V5I0Y9_BYSSN|nr:arginase, putative [Paecilomyces variotii No. 5]